MVHLRPLKAFNASSRSSRVGMSKWLVGSSNTSRATGFNKNCANATRAYELLQNKGHQGTMIFVASKTLRYLAKQKKMKEGHTIWNPES